MSSCSTRTRLLQGLCIVLPALVLTSFAPSPAQARSWYDYELEQVKALTTSAVEKAKADDCYYANVDFEQAKHIANGDTPNRYRNRIQTLINRTEKTLDRYCFSTRASGVYQRVSAIVEQAKASAASGNCAQAATQMAAARTEAAKVSRNERDSEVAQAVIASGAAIVVYSCSASPVDQGGDIIGLAKQTTALAQSGQCKAAQSTYTKANNLLNEQAREMTAGISRFLSQAKSTLLTKCGIGEATNDAALEQQFKTMQGADASTPKAATLSTSLPETSEASAGFTTVIGFTTQAREQAKSGNCQGAIQNISQAQNVANKFASEDTGLNFTRMISFATDAYEQYCGDIRQNSSVNENSDQAVNRCREMVIRIPVEGSENVCSLRLPSKKRGDTANVNSSEVFNGVIFTGMAKITCQSAGGWKAISTSCKTNATEGGASSMATKIQLDCEDQSPGATLYKTLANRCGEAADIAYWNNDIARDGLSVARQTFMTALDQNCSNYPSLSICNSALLCQYPDYTYSFTQNQCIYTANYVK